MNFKLLRRLLASALILCLTALLLGGLLPPLFAPGSRETPAVSLPQSRSERVLCIDDNRQALIRRLQLIREARTELRMTTYDLMDDESGRDILSALYDAADRGVRVRILLDGLSAIKTLPGSPRLQALAAHPNVQLRVYNPVSLLRPWRLNYRMHDKLLVSDQRLYLLGGRNTRNVSLGQYQQTFDRDRDILTVGSPDGSLGQVCDYFESLWALPEVKAVSGRFRQTAADELRSHYDGLQTRLPEAFAPVDWQRETTPAAVSLLHNPISPKNKPPVLWDQILQLMGTGRDCIVQTPYLICSSAMYQDLTRLGSSGTRVSIILNSPDTGANLPGIADYRGQKNRILKTGVSLYELVSPHSCHTKTVLIDDRLSLVGSFNFDMRSAHLDTETMLLIDCPALNRQLRQQARSAMAESRQYFPDGSRAEGEAFEPRSPGPGKLVLQKIFQLLIRPFRYLL